MRRRRLPHLEVIGRPQFITFRLRDSLPRNRLFPPSSVTSGVAFLAMDRLLDQCRCGPIFLRQDAVAQSVVASILRGVEIGHYQLHSWVIMPNHVHLLLTPQVSLSKLLGSMKAVTARYANLFLGRNGLPFWQDESYDHMVRDGDEFRRIGRYIEMNPVTACLAARPEEYEWSSARRPERPPQAEGPPHETRT
jgi:REP element-mobilizing transposase RayT